MPPHIYRFMAISTVFTNEQSQTFTLGFVRRLLIPFQKFVKSGIRSDLGCFKELNSQSKVVKGTGQLLLSLMQSSPFLVMMME